MIRSIPEDTKIEIFKFTNKESMKSMYSTLRPDEALLLKQIQELDPSFFLSSHLLDLQKKIKEKERLMTSPAYKLYQIIGDDWLIEYDDTSKHLYLEIYDNDSRFAMGKLRDTYGIIEEPEQDYTNSITILNTGVFKYPMKDLLTDLYHVNVMLHPTESFSFKDGGKTTIYSSK